MRATILNRCARAFVALGFVVAVSSTARAQQANAGPKWQALLGCWSLAVESDARLTTTPAELLVCVSPTANADVVRLTTLTNGKITSDRTLDASGAEQPLSAKGCTGTQRATWSSDGRRVYLHSAATCGGVHTTSSGILSVTATGEWLDVRGVSSGEGSSVRVARYLEDGLPSAVPADIAAELRDRAMSAQTARVAAGAPIGTSALLEASRVMDSAVVSAWLLERGQRFSVNASTLRDLARAGLPANVSDALVAVSYPNAFHFARAEPRDVRGDTAEYRGRRITAIAFPAYDPFGLGYSLYGYGYPYGYGYNRFGGYGGYGYGYGQYPYNGYTTPVIIVRGGDAGAPAHGQAIKGRGYTQRNDSPSSPPSSSSGRPSSGSGSTATATPSSSAGSSTSTTSTSTTSTTSSASSSSSSSGSSSSTERTAHARP